MRDAYGSKNNSERFILNLTFTDHPRLCRCAAVVRQPPAMGGEGRREHRRHDLPLPRAHTVAGQGPLDILINGYLIAQGEVVVVADKYGVRITDIITPSERMRRLSR